MDLTDLDKRILKLLTTDARLSSREIAKKTSTSVGTIISRIKKMEQTGLIKNYETQLNHEKLGYQITAIINITITKGKLDATIEEISTLSDVCAIYEPTGPSDIIIIVKFKTLTDLTTFTKRLQTIPNIEHINTQIALTTIKENFNGLKYV